MQHTYPPFWGDLTTKFVPNYLDNYLDKLPRDDMPSLRGDPGEPLRPYRAPWESHGNPYKKNSKKMRFFFYQKMYKNRGFYAF